MNSLTAVKAGSLLNPSTKSNFAGMKRTVLIVLALLAAAMPLKAQYYFATQSGAQASFRIYDNKGNIKGSYEETLKSLSGESLENGVAILEQVYFDKEGKHILKDKSSNLTISIQGGEVTANIETIKKGMTTQDFMIKGCVLYFPPDIGAGDHLPDRIVSVKVGRIGGNIRLSERKVLGMENVTVPAGTFQAAKVQEKQKTRVSIISEEVTIVSWIVKEVGCVRQEVYDNKGALVQTIEMVKR